MIGLLIRTLPKVRDGEPFFVSKMGTNKAHFTHTCCDCGARHDVKVTAGKKNFVFRFWRIAKGKV